MSRREYRAKTALEESKDVEHPASSQAKVQQSARKERYCTRIETTETKKVVSKKECNCTWCVRARTGDAEKVVSKKECNCTWCVRARMGDTKKVVSKKCLRAKTALEKSKEFKQPVSSQANVEQSASSQADVQLLASAPAYVDQLVSAQANKLKKHSPPNRHHPNKLIWNVMSCGPETGERSRGINRKDLTFQLQLSPTYTAVHTASHRGVDGAVSLGRRVATPTSHSSFITYSV